MNNIKILFDSLNNSLKNKIPLKKLVKTMNNVNFDDEYINFVKENKNKYNRKTVFYNENLELVIITWLPGQKALLHNHPDNGCIFKILEGEIKENFVSIDNSTSTNYYKKGDFSYIDNNLGIHDMNNIYNKRCVSLHIYSPPFIKYN